MRELHSGRGHRRKATGGLLAALGLAGLGLWGCLERNNPFDPVNYKVAPRTKASIQAKLDSLKQAVVPPAAQLAAWEASLLQAEANFDSALKIQQQMVDANAASQASNATLQQANATANDYRSLVNLVLLKKVVVAPMPGPFPDFTGKRIQVAAAQTEAQNLIQVHNANLYVDAYFTTEEKAALDETFDTAVKALAALEQRALGLAIRAEDNQAEMAAVNAAVDAQNQVIETINADLGFRRQVGDRTLVADKGTLDSLVIAAQPGDTIFLDTGRFNGRLPFEQNGAPGMPILVQGHPNLQTVLDAGGTEGTLYLSNQSHIIFRNLVFSGGTASGVKLEDGTQSVTFENCVFRDNALYGVDVQDGEATFTDCVILHNGTGGLRSVNQQFNLNNVLVAHNGGAGINLVNVSGRLNRVTSADNQTASLFVQGVMGGELRISNSIFAFSNFGFQVQGMPPTPVQIPVEDCVFYGNLAADLDVGDALLASINNIEADPAFNSRDSANGLDYRPRGGSVLADFEAQGIVIGYRPK